MREKGLDNSPSYRLDGAGHLNRALVTHSRHRHSTAIGVALSANPASASYRRGVQPKTLTAAEREAIARTLRKELTRIEWALHCASNRRRVALEVIVVHERHIARLRRERLDVLEQLAGFEFSEVRDG